MLASIVRNVPFLNDGKTSFSAKEIRKVHS